jgi:uncharacterized protein (DUF885 family)
MKLYDMYFDEYIKLFPSLNDILRIPKYKKLQVHYENNISELFIDKLKKFNIKYLNILNKNKKLNIYDKCLKYNLLQSLEGLDYNLHLMPISQFENHITNYIQLLNGTSYFIFESIQDYKDFMLKNKEFLIWCNQLIINLQLGISKKLVLPKIITKKIINDLKKIINNKNFSRNNKNVPKSLQKEWIINVKEFVLGPIKNVLEFLINIYLPECRSTLGYSSLPNGKNIYKYIVKTNITKTLSIKKIHNLGLKEIKRITTEMEKVITNLKYNKGIKQFMKYLITTPSNKYKNKEEIFKDYENTKKYLWENIIPEYFNISIKKPYEIKPVPIELEKSMAGAYYIGGDLIGSRNGIFYLNIRDIKNMLKSNCLTLSKHEGIAGHHFHITYMNENKKIPLFIKTSNYTAFIEGWALYAENLGYDKYNGYDITYFGKLNSEMLRAIRLIVDTGIHYYNWDYKKCYKLFKKYTIFPDSEIEAEIYRYVALPGQALSYKIGELTFLELRKKYMKKYNDIKSFHKLVLENGQLPLNILIDKLSKK